MVAATCRRNWPIRPKITIGARSGRDGEVKKATLRTTKRQAGRFRGMGTSYPIADAAFAVAEEPPCLPLPPTRLQRPALFLDLDGVLAPLAPTPDSVTPDARRTAVLRAVADRLEGRV